MDELSFLSKFTKYGESFISSEQMQGFRDVASKQMHSFGVQALPFIGKAAKTALDIFGSELFQRSKGASLDLAWNLPVSMVALGVFLDESSKKEGMASTAKDAENLTTSNKECKEGFSDRYILNTLGGSFLRDFGLMFSHSFKTLLDPRGLYAGICKDLTKVQELVREKKDLEAKAVLIKSFLSKNQELLEQWEDLKKKFDDYFSSCGVRELTRSQVKPEWFLHFSEKTEQDKEVLRKLEKFFIKRFMPLSNSNKVEDSCKELGVSKKTVNLDCLDQQGERSIEMSLEKIVAFFGSCFKSSQEVSESGKWVNMYLFSKLLMLDQRKRVLRVRSRMV